MTNELHIDIENVDLVCLPILLNLDKQWSYIVPSN